VIKKAFVCKNLVASLFGPQEWCARERHSSEKKKSVQQQ
jgi:hypothetical protein